MALTLAQIITNQLFQQAVLEASVKKNAFIQSGVAVSDAAIAGVLAAGGTFAEGQSINMNFVRRWDATAQMPGTIAQPVVPDGTTMGQDAAPFILRDFAFAAESFAGERANHNFAASAAAQIGEVHATFWQRTLFGVLEGVFSNNTLPSVQPTVPIPALGNDSDLVMDISSDMGDKTSLLDAAQLLGDAKGKLAAIAMHSQAETYFNQIGSISYVAPAKDMPAILPYYNGRPIIVDDECPFDPSTGVAAITLFAQGAVAYNNIARANPFGTERDEKANADTLVSRIGGIMHLRGIKYKGAYDPRKTPTDASLKSSASWERVWDKKLIGCCRLLCKVA